MIVFFDIGATLIAGPGEAPARMLARRLGLDDARRRDVDRRLLTGAIAGRTALARHLVEAAGADPAAAAAAVDEVWESQAAGPAIVPGGPEALAALAESGIAYGFVSNIWQPYADSFLRLYGGLAAGRPCLFSYRLGLAKPDPAIYRAAVDAVGARAADCVMVGDSYDNDVAPALAAGLRTVWLLHRPDKERRFVEDVAAGRLASPHATFGSVAALSDPILYSGILQG